MISSELRDIADKAIGQKAGDSWEKIKKDLLEGLVSIAKTGKYGVSIGYTDKLGTIQGINWVADRQYRDKVKDELERLGYEFIYNDSIQGEFVIIRW